MSRGDIDDFSLHELDVWKDVEELSMMYDPNYDLDLFIEKLQSDTDEIPYLVRGEKY